MKNCLYPFAVVCLLGLRAVPTDAAPPAPAHDIEVTIRFADGFVEKYDKQLAEMEIVVDGSGAIRYVHLALMHNGVKDSHCWYNYANVANLSYRFLAVTGKSKVRVKQLAAFPAKPPEGVLPGKIGTMQAEDFR